MSNRKRMTWAAGRRASAPPATPGYGTEDQDHPAHQPDPAYEAYKKGDPSAWAEDPHPYPYPEGNPPATPGYDTEDQDHPAHKRYPRVPKEATLRQAVERKAARCIRLARHMLGKKATEQMVEDQALDLMDMPDGQLNATLKRLGGGFLAQDMMDEDMCGDGICGPTEDDLSCPEDCGPESEDLDMMLGMDDEDDEGNDMEAMFGMYAQDDLDLDMDMPMEDDMGMMVMADQNSPSGPTLAPKPQSEEQERGDAAATAKGEAKGAAVLFDSYDLDGDGFVTAEDWTGNRAIFAALDTDGDGIIARAEAIAALAGSPKEAAMYEGLDAEERAMLAEMLGSRTAADDDEEGADEEEAADEEDDEGAEAAKKKAKKEVPPEFLEQQKKKKEEADKEACGPMGMEPMDESAMFSMTGDPMGLEGQDDDEGDEDEMLAAIFGGKVAKKKSQDEDEGDEEESEEESEEEPEEEEEETEEEETEEVEEKEGGKKSKKKAAQRPQPQKPRMGVKSVGRMSKAAAQGDGEIGELSKLWDSDPDVSDVFGS